MSKARLIKQIVASLSESLGVLENAARASREEATHESSRAESKYDTRGLEAAYLAGGQARQAREIMDAIKLYESLPSKDFGPDDPIEMTAVVEVEIDRVRSTFFIGPRNGGLEVQHDGVEITVITPQSPLGEKLMGRKAGERWATKSGSTSVKYRVLSVK